MLPGGESDDDVLSQAGSGQGNERKGVPNERVAWVSNGDVTNRLIRE